VQELQRYERVPDVSRENQHGTPFASATTGRIGMTGDEQFDEMKQRLGSLDQRLDKVDQGFDKVDQRLDKVDQRFAEVDRRFDKVDQRFDEVDRRFEKVEGRLDTLTSDVQKLRVLGEENRTQITLIAEVQSHHGDQLDQLVKDIEPLKVLPDMLKHVVEDHERRITALEKAAQ
jgi:chromosome segregation ATPase